MPKGKCTTFDAFYEAVEAVRSNPEQYKGLSIPEASLRLTTNTGNYVAKSVIHEVYAKAGVQRTTVRGQAATKMKTEVRVARNVIRTFLNMGALPAEIDNDLLEMAGWQFSDLVAASETAVVDQLTMAAMASVRDNH